MDVSEKCMEFLNRRDVQIAIQGNKMEQLYQYVDEVGPLFTGELTKILMNSGVDPLPHLKKIPDYYLWSNEEIETLSIPPKIDSIGENAFAFCSNLRLIEIPTSVKSFGFDCFHNCHDPFTIKYGGTMEQWREIMTPDEYEDFKKGIPKKTIIQCTDGEFTIDYFSWSYIQGDIKKVCERLWGYGQLYPVAAAYSGKGVHSFVLGDGTGIYLWKPEEERERIQALQVDGMSRQKYFKALADIMQDIAKFYEYKQLV